MADLKWRALSLTQPWAWIILNLGKRVENRPRNIGNYRGPLLLHAAKRMTIDDCEAAYRFVAERFGSAVAERIPRAIDPVLVRGAIVGRCCVVNQCRPGAEWPRGRATALPLTPIGWSEQQRWYMGAHAYMLADVQPTKVVPCSGALGFWRPPARVLAELGLEAA